ncbi:hybrid sensor histidine kinase/response regulator [Moorena producens PAL-8-15-08-1]|uniref:histidine kinase n=1 Tax=Moorena producens PAL-8-15-08-1 TaxID=1458985 RepID=A0A1D8TSM0_9CYAN|nr:ATP-binding protein [Moorena producens]AOX00617.1 hybrid sensor histidine kinase/response regulator [Moorena producens PAL-8-15-08-1]
MSSTYLPVTSPSADQRNFPVPSPVPASVIYFQNKLPTERPDHSDCTRILLIEDDIQDVELIKALLKKAKHFPATLTHVETLEQGLECLKYGNIDIVLCDLFLPDQQGLETFCEIYAQFPEMPIIILSGLTDENLAIEALQEGAQDYLVKGEFDRNLLIRAMRYGIERQRLLLALKRKTEALRASEEQFRTMITRNADGVVIIDHNRVIQFVNPAAEYLMNCKAEKLQGELWCSSLVVGQSTELDIRSSYGKIVIAEIQLVEIQWEGKKAYMASLRDITTRKEIEIAQKELNDELERRVEERTVELRVANAQLQVLELKLRQSLVKEKELSNFKSRIISSISHEYRTPLTTISSSAAILERYGHKINPTQQVKHCRRIQSMVQHLTGLVDDVLFINKTEFDQLDFQPAPIDLVIFCNKLVDEIQSKTTDKHQILFSHEGDYKEFTSDPKLLRQMLTNLLSNAIKYSPQGGKVELNAKCDNNQVILEVKDEGIGIPKHDQGELFNSFSRGSNIGSIAGIGLGLSIVKSYVEQHQGEIVMASKIGVGTRVTVSLPFLR